jgi:SAM-dependent methyltransferase
MRSLASAGAAALRPFKRATMAALFPVHRVLLRTAPSAAWRLAQVAERRHWRLELERTGHLPGLPNGSRRSEIQRRNLDLYRQAFGEPFIQRFGRVLEVGCGPGGPIALMDASGRVGLDPLLPFGLGAELSQDGVMYVNGVAEALPLRAGSVDAVVCVNVLDHLPSPEVAISEFARVLRPGGKLFLSCDVDPPRRTTVDYVLHPGRRHPNQLRMVLGPRFTTLSWSVGPGHRNPQTTALSFIGVRATNSGHAGATVGG